jgi:hypothetical protein
MSPKKYLLKLFIANKSSCLKADSNPNYQELVKMYKEKVEAHNKKVNESQYADSGFDLFIPFDYSEHENGYTDNHVSKVTFRAPLGVKCRLSNSVGIIDSGYRGEIMAVVDNIDSVNNDMKVCIRKYMTPMTRMFQICSPTLEPFLVEIVDDEEHLGFTERGSGGFGSTGL